MRTTQAGDVIDVNGVACTTLHAAIDIAASGDLIAAVAGKTIRVLALVLSVATTTTIKFQSGAATDLTGAMTITAGTPLVLPFNPHGWLITGTAAKLNAVLGASVQVSGRIVYATV